eukprot:Nk52_evm81s207 gene=Nk52_evmTU81s207
MDSPTGSMTPSPQTQPQQGMRVRARVVNDKSYFENLTDYIQEILPLPQSIVKSLPGAKRTSGTASNGGGLSADDGGESVEWVKVESVDAWHASDQGKGQPPKNLYVVIGYGSGFQIWDMSLKSSESAVEIFSKRSGVVKLVRFLPPPVYKLIGQDPIKDRLKGARPLIALLSGDTSSQEFPPSVVKLYSLKNQQPVHTFRFKSVVHNFLCNDKFLIVVLKGNLFIFDSVTFQNLHTINDCYVGSALRHRNSMNGLPDPRSWTTGNINPCALGSRWLAYAGNEPPTDICQNSDLDKGASLQSGNSVLDAASGVAKDIASGLYYLGDKGVKTMSSYLSDANAQSSRSRYPQSNQESSGETGQTVVFENVENTSRDNSFSGCITVTDLVSGRKIANFRAHSNHSVSYLEFDPSGTLLVMSSSQGRNFYVFQILGDSFDSKSFGKSGSKYRVRLLYKLYRGITNSILQNISFSSDSRWVALTSTRGTTHLYAINPLGGPVSVDTHCSPSVTNVVNSQYTSSGLSEIRDCPPEMLILPAVVRIKQGPANEEENSEKLPVSVYFGRQVDAPKDSVHADSPYMREMLLVNYRGLATQFDVIPQGPTLPALTSAAGDPKVLHVTCKSKLEWSLRRYIVNSEVTCPYSGRDGDKKTSKKESWLSNVEICTHSAPYRPLWMGPQFTFKTYCDTGKPKSTEQPATTAMNATMTPTISSKKKKKKNSSNNTNNSSNAFEGLNTDLIDLDSPLVSEQDLSGSCMAAQELLIKTEEPVPVFKSKSSAGVADGHAENGLNGNGVASSSAVKSGVSRPTNRRQTSELIEESLMNAMGSLLENGRVFGTKEKEA